MTAKSVQFRYALLADLPDLLALEQASFSGDRLSRRRLLHWIQADNAFLLVAEREQRIVAYALVLLRKGQRLARLYSLAVAKEYKGQGIGRLLLQQAEIEAAQRGWQVMRLEVAENNHAAIALYESQAYRVFATYPDYYDDHQNALRMEKNLF